jgi:hypothetical protein
MVTNKGYSSNSKREGKKSNVVLCKTENLIKNIMREIKMIRKLKKKEEKESNELIVEVSNQE